MITKTVLNYEKVESSGINKTESLPLLHGEIDGVKVVDVQIDNEVIYHYTPEKLEKGKNDNKDQDRDRKNQKGPEMI